MDSIRLLVIALAVFSLPIGRSFAATDQEKEAARNATRDQLREVLDGFAKRSGTGVEFKQLEGRPYNFAGVMKANLKYADTLEIVVGVTNDATIGFRVYPHVNGAYINISKAKDSAGLMRRLLRFGGTNFLFWAVDDTDDVFSGYTVTLESGFPKEAIWVILGSIHNTDGFVEQLLPFLDGTKPPEST